MLRVPGRNTICAFTVGLSLCAGYKVCQQAWNKDSKSKHVCLLSTTLWDGKSNSWTRVKVSWPHNALCWNSAYFAVSKASWRSEVTLFWQTVYHAVCLCFNYFTMSQPCSALPQLMYVPYMSAKHSHAILWALAEKIVEMCSHLVWIKFVALSGLVVQGHLSIIVEFKFTSSLHT